ncbi:multidrug transporter MatE [Fructilactobacillus lindneri]|uniref:Efflux transporter n=2 Tax=Fructilactobacillus lindneri TaxID=53444 RepID=A0A0R2JNC3_9LACO|nr:MATE family efflux transporter [Fructilactobacillus lindneri]ANZ57869.1 multidrug transporter MatE [Fructilactobacillus lindneri]ANZ59138.1 multidrug transporter MatE [Fructilactobacillus lindneri]KRN78672.1 efflux transporter [Fructilactobacillus lindneri DSM 20690 = JCM 11027]POG98191.1 multidrug transporter MatE [Fructilactobacillus lindneri]POH01693.1 multidrug transporter MatE [Fructilactobacillus lindneri]
MNNNLETMSISKLLNMLIFPSLITVLVSGSYNIIDGIFIGQKLGVMVNSANAFTFMIYAIVYSFSALVSQGASSLLTIYAGKKDKVKFKQTLIQGIMLSILISIIQALLIWFFLSQIMCLLGADAKYFKFITEFTLVFLLGSPFYFVAHTLLYDIRAEGKIKNVLIINVIAFFTNLTFGSFLILKLNLGFTGSALATIIANIVICVLSGFYYLPYLKNSVKITKIFDFSSSLKILSMGLPFFLTSSFSVILLSFYNRIAIAYGGIYGLAALSVVSSIYRYVISLMNAITTGVQPVISYNYGAGLNLRVKKSLNYSLKVATIFTLILFFLLELFAANITELFNPHDIAFVTYAAKALQIVMLSLPLQGIINIGTSYFQYIENAKVSTSLVILRQVVFQVPLAFLLSHIISINGLWFSYVLSDILIFIVIIYLIRANYKKIAY